MSKEIENGSKMSLDSGLSWIFVFVGGRSVWCRNKWGRATVGPQGRGAPRG